VQRRAGLVVGGVHIDPILQRLNDRLWVPPAAREVQRRLTSPSRLRRKQR
jgi:hypothetical protein